jgi:hypothetical protein
VKQFVGTSDKVKFQPGSLIFLSKASEVGVNMRDGVDVDLGTDTLPDSTKAEAKP